VAASGTLGAVTAHPEVECGLTDMDGVLVHEGAALPGAAEFFERLVERERRFLVLTNNSIFTPRHVHWCPARGSASGTPTRAPGALERSLPS